MSVLYGYFSQRAFDLGSPSHIYMTFDNKEVEVTAVCEDPEGSKYKWGDKEFVGRVTQWIRPGQKLKEQSYDVS